MERIKGIRGRRITLAISAVVSALASATAAGNEDDWNVASGTWSVLGNWKGRVPVSGDDVVLRVSGATSSCNIAGLSLNSLAVDELGNGVLYGLEQNQSLTIVDAYVGKGNNTISGSWSENQGITTTITHALYIGYLGGGDFDLHAGSTLTTPTMLVGYNGGGTFSQYAGTAGDSERSHCVAPE